MNSAASPLGLPRVYMNSERESGYLPLATFSALGSQPWPSFNMPEYRAGQLYAAYQNELAAFPVKKVQMGWTVSVNGIEQDCRVYRDSISPPTLQ